MLKNMLMELNERCEDYGMKMHINKTYKIGLCVCMCLCVCVCLSVFVCDRQRERERESERERERVGVYVCKNLIPH